MKRRCVAAACAIAVLSQRSALARQPARIKQIGWLGNSAPVTPEGIAVWDAFRLELHRLGWLEGRDIAFERRFAEGDVELFPRLARELIDRKVDLIVAVCGNAARAAKNSTASIPVVFASVASPVEQGLVASLARPAGNLTGMPTQSDETIGKRLHAVDLKDPFRRATGLVDKVLRGALPADIPVQQPTKFELTINLGTARALGLKIPQSVLLRADEVIE